MGGTGARYRVICTKSIVPKHLRKIKADDKKDAETKASLLDAAIRSGRIDGLKNPEELAAIKKVVEDFRITKIWEQQNPSRWEKELEWQDVMDVGRNLILVLNRQNSFRESKGLAKLGTEEAIRKLDHYLQEASEKAIAPLFKDLLAKFLEYKTSKHGGRGNTELQPTTISGWKKTCSLLVEAIGDYRTTEERKVLRDSLRDRLNRGFDARKRNLGTPWSPATKHNYATGAWTFGKWCMEEEDVLKYNPFTNFPSKFTPTKQARAKILKVEQVEKLFEVMASSERFKKMGPYFTLLFFSGVRPYEAANPSQAHRRLQWECFDGWRGDSVVSGGKLFQVVSEDALGRNMSKSNIDRTADLTANGVKWIKFFHGGNLPTKGEVYYLQEILQEIRTAAGLWGKDAKGKPKWPNDVARHSMASYADQNQDFTDKQGGWWQSCLGHTHEVFLSRYRNPVINQVDRTRYFNIFPPKEKDSDKAQE